MDDPNDPGLERSLKAERVAFQRCELLKGYPPDDQVAALAQFAEVKEAVRKYRTKLP